MISNGNQCNGPYVPIYGVQMSVCSVASGGILNISYDYSSVVIYHCDERFLCDKLMLLWCVNIAFRVFSFFGRNEGDTFC